MKRSNVAGVCSIIVGGLLWGYQALGDFMGRSTQLSSSKGMQGSEGIDYYAMVDMLHEDNFDWIDSIPWPPVLSAADYLVTMPLFILFFVIGAITLVIGGIFIKK